MTLPPSYPTLAYANSAVTPPQPSSMLSFVPPCLRAFVPRLTRPLPPLPRSLSSPSLSLLSLALPLLLPSVQFFNVVFTLELLVRLIIAKSFIMALGDFYNWVDFFSVRTDVCMSVMSVMSVSSHTHFAAHCSSFSTVLVRRGERMLLSSARRHSVLTCPPRLHSASPHSTPPSLVRSAFVHRLRSPRVR